MLENYAYPQTPKTHFSANAFAKKWLLVFFHKLLKFVIYVVFFLNNICTSDCILNINNNFKVYIV